MAIIRNQRFNQAGVEISAEIIDTVASTLTPVTNSVVGSPRALTAEEIAQYITGPAADANRATIEASFLTFIDGADTAIANMQAIQNDPAPTFSTLAQALAQVTALQNRVKLIASTEEAHIRKTVALARYVSNQLDSLDNT